MKKKILYITTIAGFLPQFEKNDVRIVREMGYEVHYASNFNNPVYAFDAESLKKQGMILHHIDIAKSPADISTNYRAVKQIKAIIDEENINMIHCHNPMGGVAGRVAAHLSKKKPYVIYTAHGFHFYEGAPPLNWLLYYPAERFLAHWTDAIVTINTEDYERAKRKFRLKPNGFVGQIHGVGVDMTRFCPRPDISAAKRDELGIPRDAFHIVTAAELNFNKNQKVIIEAIAKCETQDIYYSLCGKGPGQNALERLIKKYHLENRVRLLGFRTDMEEILQTADVFAFPSIREGLGIAAIEALACGVPLIAADNRGTREYVVSGVNGIVCVPRNAEMFQTAIRSLCQDKIHRKKLAEACRATVERFSMEKTMETMQRVYRKADKNMDII